MTWAATAATTLAVVLLAYSLATGRSHLAFQFVRSPVDYAALLAARGHGLRLELGLDYLFLCCYTALFALLHAALRNWRTSARVPVWLVLMVGSALLDALENAQLVAMASAAEQGLPVLAGQVIAQAVIGQLKFLTNCAGLLTLSFALPRRTAGERALVFFLRWIQAPLGAALLVLPPAFVRPVALARIAGLIVGLGALARIAWLRRTGSY